MKIKPLVSIIVSVYNVDAYINECISSLRSQSYSCIEIIIVNDGSTDNSLIICKHHAQEDSRIKIINQRNLGLISSRKEGIKYSRGEYIAFVDGDDWVEPDMYETMILMAEETNSQIVASGHLEDINNIIMERALNRAQPGFYSTIEERKHLYSTMLYNPQTQYFGIYTYAWSKLFERNLLIKSISKVDDKISIGEDAAITYPALLNAFKIFITDKAQYHYRKRFDSMMNEIKNPNQDLNQLNT